MFSLELQGYAHDGKPAASTIGNPFSTIQGAKAEAYRLYMAKAYGSLAIAFGYRVLDGAGAVVSKGQF